MIDSFLCGALQTEVLLGTSLIRYASAEEVMLGFRLSTYLFFAYFHQSPAVDLSRSA